MIVTVVVLNKENVQEKKGITLAYSAIKKITDWLLESIGVWKCE